MKKYGKAAYTDLIGKKFGLLTVLSRAENTTIKYDYHTRMFVNYNVQCICGETLIARSIRLKQGNTKTCGNNECRKVLKELRKRNK